jgi:hypothetical protein
MTAGFTCVGTRRKFPSTFLLACSMINSGCRVLTKNTGLTLALAGVATRQISRALNFAFIIRKRHIDVAMDDNLMFTNRNNLLNGLMAANARKVFILPAR